MLCDRYNPRSDTGRTYFRAYALGWVSEVLSAVTQIKGLSLCSIVFVLFAPTYHTETMREKHGMFVVEHVQPLDQRTYLPTYLPSNQPANITAHQPTNQP